MRTEIVIPFTFDTAPVEKLLQEQGEAEAMKVLTNIVMEGIKKTLPEKRYPCSYGYGERKEPDVDWRKYIDDKAHEWLDSHMEEIIDEAALLMAAKGGRRKAWREVLAEIKEQ